MELLIVAVISVVIITVIGFLTAKIIVKKRSRM